MAAALVRTLTNPSKGEAMAKLTEQDVLDMLTTAVHFLEKWVDSQCEYDANLAVDTMEFVKSFRRADFSKGDEHGTTQR